MSRRYATPLAFKTAVEERLRSDVLGSHLDLNRRRQLLIFDRCLARLFAVFGDSILLKGGLVLELRLERARTTKDIDLRMIGDPELVLLRLQEAGRTDLGDHLSFEVLADPRHPVIDAEGLAYQGLRFRAQAQFAGKVYGAPFGIDVSFAEPLSGAPEVIVGSRFLEFAGLSPALFRVYPLETHVAEKLHAYTLPRRRPNTRVKDLPDLALLASVRDLEGTALRAAIDRTFVHRATHPVPESVPDPPEAWAPVFERIASSDGLEWRSLPEVTRAVRECLDPVLSGRAGIWRRDRWSWSGESEVSPD